MDKSTLIKSPLNYTGGKYKLLPQILPLFPQSINTFVDLFTGGANVVVNINAKRLIANDIEPHIINIFSQFQKADINQIVNDIESTVEHWKLTKTDAAPFNAFRNHYNEMKLNATDKNTYELAMQLFVLICFSFNHQFRFNSSGEFNMPFGKDRSAYNKNIKNNLINFIGAIQEKGVIFTNKDFNELKVNKLRSDDLVYCDPPYLVTCATYNEKDGWNEQQEKKLLTLLDKLNEQNVKFALSNVLFSKGKTNDMLIDWCKKYNTHHLDYTYQNCNYHTKDKNTKPDEVLITNY